MSEGDLRLHSAIAAHDLFFSHIISMIPRDLYKPEEEEDLENLNKRYHKHRKLPLTSDERKVIGKKKIKEKYEPREEEGDDFSHQQTAVEDFSLPSEDLGLEGLKQRLQERIHSLRATRGDGSKHQRKSDVKTKSKTEKKSTNSAHKSHHQTNSVVPAEEAVATTRSIRDDLLTSHDDGEADVEYSKFIESSMNISEPGKPGSKTKRLQRMLEEADRKRQRIEELKSQGKEGKDRVRAEQWSEVIQEASGQKVLINTSKIKKALKRRTKSKEKSAVQWQERLSEVEAAKVKKQEKREENILKRKIGSVPQETTSTKPAEGKKIGVKIGTPNRGAERKDQTNNSSQQRAGFEGKKKEFLNKKSRN